jgi:hypothetical protein
VILVPILLMFPSLQRYFLHHGMDEADYGYWGFSAASNPYGGYGAYGAPPLGMSPDGYPSDLQGTKVDYGFGSCRPAGPPPASWGDGVVTPHASFLALRCAPQEAMANLAQLRQNFPVYGAGGFKDSVAVRSGKVSDRYLALDQGMILGAVGNAVAGDVLRADFSRDHRPRGPGGPTVRYGQQISDAGSSQASHQRHQLNASPVTVRRSRHSCGATSGGTAAAHQ